jgi:hypothetical protein
MFNQNHDADYAACKAEYERLCAINDAHGKTWRDIPGVGSGPMGLTPEHIRTSAAYQSARANFEASKLECGKFATPYLKRFKREIAADRAARYAAKSAAFAASNKES